MAVEVRYTSRRAEIWRWYWKKWARGLWRVHLAAMAAVASAVLIVHAGAGMKGPMALEAISVCALMLAFLIFYPQLQFKPQERTLILQESGVSTVVGRRHGMRSWAEVSSITEEDGAIVIGIVNGNAFIVPSRAFRSASERADFLAFAQRAQTTASPQAADLSILPINDGKGGGWRRATTGCVLIFASLALFFWWGRHFGLFGRQIVFDGPHMGLLTAVILGAFGAGYTAGGWRRGLMTAVGLLVLVVASVGLGIAKGNY